MLKEPARKTPSTAGKQAKSKTNEVEIPLTELSSDTLASMTDLVLDGKIETNDPLGDVTMLTWLAREKRNLEEPEQLRHKIIYVDAILGSRTIMSQFLEHNVLRALSLSRLMKKGLKRYWHGGLI